MARTTQGRREAARPRRASRGVLVRPACTALRTGSARPSGGAPRSLRRQPEQSGAQKLMQGIRGMLPGGGGKSSAGRRSGGSIPVVGGLLGSLGGTKKRGAPRGRKPAVFGLLGAARQALRRQWQSAAMAPVLPSPRARRGTCPMPRRRRRRLRRRLIPLTHHRPTQRLRGPIPRRTPTPRRRATRASRALAEQRSGPQSNDGRGWVRTSDLARVVDAVCGRSGWDSLGPRLRQGRDNSDRQIAPSRDLRVTRAYADVELPAANTSGLRRPTRRGSKRRAGRGAPQRALLTPPGPHARCGGRAPVRGALHRDQRCW